MSRHLALPERGVGFLAHPDRWAKVILGAFFVLGLLYGVMNPTMEGPDEICHYPYIAHLADGRGLPIQDPRNPTLMEQEASQPPLYYALMAALSFWIDDSDLPSVRYLNPHAQIGIPLAQDNKNILIHRREFERFPWRGTVLAVHWVRFWSLLMGVGTLGCLYALAKRALPQQPEIALGALVLAAFNPQFIFISASVNNDNLVILLSTAALGVMARWAQGERSLKTLGIGGALIGLACLSKLSALGLVPLAGLALALHPAQTAWVAYRRTGRIRCKFLRRWLGEYALVIGIAALLAGWWYLRNWALYGDPTGLNAMLDVFGKRTHQPTLAEMWDEFRGLRISFWGLFGVVNILFQPTQIYLLLDALMLLSIAGLAYHAARHIKALPQWLTSPQASVILLLAAWKVIIAASLFHWTSQTKASQGRLLFPAIASLALFMAWGLLAWFPVVARRQVLGGLTAFLGVLAISAPFTSIAPAYAPPPILRPEEIPPSAQPFNTSYGDVLRLVAYEVSPRTVHPGESLRVRLYWQPLAPMGEDYSVYLHLIGWAGERLGQRDSYLGMGTYPTSAWQVGHIVQETYLLPVKKAPDAPIAAELNVGVYRFADMARLPIFDGEGRPIEHSVLTRIKVRVPTPEQTPPYAAEANWDDRILLKGYDLTPSTAAAGGEFTLTLYWQVRQTPQKDYTVFIHLMDAQGEMIGQGDGPPCSGRYPTSLWEPGEALRDVHTLSIRPGAAPGLATLWVGWYDLPTGQRLPLTGREANPENAFRLAEIRIIP